MSYKVLGASEKNLRAISNALSMKDGKKLAGKATPDLQFKEEINATGEIEVPPQGVYIPLAISGVLTWFPLSGFGPIVLKKEFDSELSSDVYNVSVAQAPSSSEGEFVFSNYNFETSGYFGWLGIDECQTECEDNEIYYD